MVRTGWDLPVLIFQTAEHHIHSLGAHATETLTYHDDYAEQKTYRNGAHRSIVVAHTIDSDAVHRRGKLGTI